MWIDFNFTLLSLTFVLFFWKKLNFIVIESWKSLNETNNTNCDTMPYLILELLIGDEVINIDFIFWSRGLVNTFNCIYLALILMFICFIVFIKTYLFYNHVFKEKYSRLNNRIYIKSYNISTNNKWLHKLKQGFFLNKTAFIWYWRVRRYNGYFWHWSQLVTELRSIKKHENKLLRYTSRKFFKKSKYFLKQRNLLYTKLSNMYLFSSNFKLNYTLHQIVFNYYVNKFSNTPLLKFNTVFYKLFPFNKLVVRHTIWDFFNLSRGRWLVCIKQSLIEINILKSRQSIYLIYIFFYRDVLKFKIDYVMHLTL